ncbi:hypothetical protein [Erythrobacter mangrovi]|uniref:Uncharacterized protein n=1 Tax=Erythrobacter mangrovi TaxID=2739433 RepID=A0A7D4BGY1_9SPHN|nr:hypothetical protein [Erythrobacter mangrovi]QKG71882.1 hypothetical protein HQR01_11225 [Erythrobacter mangrovi]
MNAITPHPDFIQSDFPVSPPLGAEPVPASAEGAEDQDRFSIFTPRAQGEFLKSLQFNGNVRLACRAARVSAQTAYRARRRSPGFARAWDVALLAARDHAEQVLADRALNGVEEAVFYHGEEVARRRRYDSRLLLAHLARLDKLAERPELHAALGLLDEQIEGLFEGTPISDNVPPANPWQNPVPPVPSCRYCGGQCETPGAELGPEDCRWLLDRYDRMEAARPKGAKETYELTPDGDRFGEIDKLQLEAFEADGHEWWLVTTEEEMMASILHNYEEEGEDEYEGEELAGEGALVGDGPAGDDAEGDGR